MPVTLHDPPTRGGVPFAAAAALGRGAITTHAGLYYQHVDGDTRLLHLARHLLLCEETVGDAPSAAMGWIAPAIPKQKLMVLAALCTRFAARNEAPPYGFAFVASSIEDDGRLAIGDGEVGFTCATLVLALFQRAQVELLDRPTWQDADETRQLDDRKAQTELVALMARHSESHASRMALELPTPRYRAEELAAATALEPLPVAFAEAANEGAQLLASAVLRPWWAT